MPLASVQAGGVGTAAVALRAARHALGAGAALEDLEAVGSFPAVPGAHLPLAQHGFADLGPEVAGAAQPRRAVRRAQAEVALLTCGREVSAEFRRRPRPRRSPGPCLPLASGGQAGAGVRRGSASGPGSSSSGAPGGGSGGVQSPAGWGGGGSAVSPACPYPPSPPRARPPARPPLTVAAGRARAAHGVAQAALAASPAREAERGAAAAGRPSAEFVGAAVLVLGAGEGLRAGRGSAPLPTAR